jgi:MFS family permease
MILVCVSFIGLLILTDFFTLILPFFLMGATYTFWPLMGAVVGSIAPDASRGRWMSVSQTTCMLATFLAPYVGGILYEASPHKPFIVAIVAIPLLSIFALSKLSKKD